MCSVCIDSQRLGLLRKPHLTLSLEFCVVYCCFIRHHWCSNIEGEIRYLGQYSNKSKCSCPSINHSQNFLYILFFHSLFSPTLSLPHPFTSNILTTFLDKVSWNFSPFLSFVFICLQFFFQTTFYLLSIVFLHASFAFIVFSLYSGFIPSFNYCIVVSLPLPL